MDFFRGLFGSKEARRILSSLLDRGDFWRTFLFVGLDGVGKFLFAERFAMSILCEGDERPCFKCRMCLSYKSGMNPFIKVVEPERDKISISQVRDIISFVHVRSSRGKIVIIREAESMTPSASNAFLKTLEEIPERTCFILIASSPDALLPTVRSRCFVVRFSALSMDEMKKLLEAEGFHLDEEEFQVLYYLSGGSVGLMKDFLERDMYRLVEKVYYGIKRKDMDILTSIFLGEKDIVKKVLDGVLSYMIMKEDEEMDKVIKAYEFLERGVKSDKVAKYLAEF